MLVHAQSAGHGVLVVLVACGVLAGGRAAVAGGGVASAGSVLGAGHGLVGAGASGVCA